MTPIRFHRLETISPAALLTRRGRERAIQQWILGAHNWEQARQAVELYKAQRGGVPDAKAQELQGLLVKLAGRYQEGNELINSAIAKARDAGRWRSDWPEDVRGLVEARSLWPSGLGAVPILAIVAVLVVFIAVAFFLIYRTTQPMLMQATAQGQRLATIAQAEAKRVESTPPGVPVTLPDVGGAGGSDMARALTVAGAAVFGLLALAVFAPFINGERR